MKKKITSILLTILFGGILYYISLPAINFTNVGFYMYIFMILIFYYFIDLTLNFNLKRINLRNRKPKLNILYLIPLVCIILVIVNVINSPLFMSKKYATRITINQDKNFTTDIKEVDFTKLPLLDKASSQKLGDRVMGQMSDMVSQYDVSDLYTQINYNNQILRVTPLEYASPIKWLTNRKEGVKGYITVDSVNGEAKLTRLKKGMKYLPSGLFNDNLTRVLRFKYPTLNFGDYSFEIDNEGNPYWVVPVIKYHGIELRAEVSGVVVLDAITGKSVKYNVGSIPTWIDIAYSADLIIEQVDDWGTYQDGFLNSVFGQKNVVNTTGGYNYLAMNDDIYLYTGLTSIVNDESNLGFILTNMRTNETSFYSAPGAEEYSAMASAEGAVQQMGYKSTFPLLINLNNKPTYLVSLKDAAGLVKMYGFVDVSDYQKVVVTDSSKGIEQAAKNYLGKDFTEEDDTKLTEKEITIKSIKTATIDGNTYYYLIDKENNKYKVSIKVSDKLPYLKADQSIKIGYSQEAEITIIKKIF